MRARKPDGGNAGQVRVRQEDCTPRERYRKAQDAVHRREMAGPLVEDDGIRCRCTLFHPRVRWLGAGGEASPLRCVVCGERVEAAP